MDLGIAAQAGGVAVLLGTGGAAFAAPMVFPAVPAPQALAVGDFNADGIPDIVVTGDSTTPNLALLIGGGDGTFGAPEGFAVAGTPAAVAASDSGQGSGVDIVVASSRPANGTAPPLGMVDLLPGLGGAAFGSQVTFPVGLQPSALVVGDFNADGLPDLAVTNFSAGTVSILLGIGAAEFGPQVTFAAGNNPVALATADLNGDGFLDLAVANLADDGPQPGTGSGVPASVTVLLGTGTGAFRSTASYGTFVAPSGIIAANFRGGDTLDLAVTDEENGKTGSVSILVGAGGGTFGEQVSVPVGSGPRAIAAADLNGDGRADLAVVDCNSGTVTLLLNNCSP